MGQRLALVALREERCRPPRPAVCAVAGAGPPVPCRFPSDVPSACVGAAASGTFFRKALDSCERLMRHPRAPRSRRVGGRSSSSRRSATGSSSNGVTTRNAVSALHRRRPRRDTCFQGVRPPPPAEIAAPQPDRIFAHAERLGDPRTGPARKRQQNGARPVRLPRLRESARAKRPPRCSSFAVTGDFPATPHTSRIGTGAEPKTYPLVNQTESAQRRDCPRPTQPRLARHAGGRDGEG